MNSNLFTLIKIEFLKVLSGFNKKNKKISKTPVFYIALLILFLGILLSVTYSSLIIYPYKDLGTDPSPAVALFSGLTALLIFMTAMRQARGIYIGEDYELLITLPIKKRDIVTSKVISLFALEMVFSLMIMIPHGAMIMVITQNVELMLISFLLAFTIPIVPIALAIFISFLVTMATSRFKAANMISTILYAAVIIVFSGSGMFLSRLSSDTAANSFSAIGSIIKWINPSYIFIELALSTNKLFLLAYIGVTIVVAFIAIAFVIKFYERLHDIVSSISMKKEYVRKDLKNKSEGHLLLSLQFKRLVNSKMYFVNTIMGGVMSILGSLVFLISFNQGFASAEGDAIELSKRIVMPIFIATCLFIFAISNPVSSTLNIEGKNFWLTKSLPINYKKYMMSQLYFAWIITLPPSLVTSSIAVIFYHDNALDVVFAYLIPLLFNIFISLIDLAVSVHHTNLKWSNETEAIKNSKSVVITMFINWGVMGLIAPASIVLAVVVPEFTWIGYLVTALSLIIPSIPIAIYLNKYYSKRIELIEDL